MQVGKAVPAPAPAQAHEAAQAAAQERTPADARVSRRLSGLAWTVLIVEAAGVVLLLLTASLLWRQRQP